MNEKILDGKRSDTSRRKSRWLKIVTTLAAVVVFITTYALIMPAVTKEQETFCGLEEHEHSDECFEKVLSCEENAEPHVHGEECRKVTKVLRCTLEEKEGHVHGEDCCEKVLICEQTGDAGHVHTEDCYEERRTQICTLEESEGHVHGEDCYTETDVLVCTLEESEGHAHGGDCYAEENVLICPEAEDGEHTHGADCYEKQQVLVCTEEEREPHTHGGDCYEKQRTLVCTGEEREPHTHGGDCFETEKVLVCTEEEREPHVHDENCYEKKLVCTVEEEPGHVHGEECYTEKTEYICGLEEGAVTHVHTEDCYTLDKENAVCGTESHLHTLQCFSDPEADVETAEDWEKTLEKVSLTGNWQEDLLSVARTQLGYVSSTANYMVSDDGATMRGYSRYGAWYGDPYGEWCAMFISFCLRHAGVDAALVPTEASCPRWVQLLQERGLYVEAAAGEPRTGDLVFFDYGGKNADGKADHVGIVSDLFYDGDTMKLVSFNTLEGNHGGAVRYFTYTVEDENLLGYGRLPMNPEWFDMKTEGFGGVKVEVSGERDALPYPAEEISLVVSLSSDEKEVSILNEQLAADGLEDAGSILLDVSLFHGDEVIEPTGEVKLSFTTPEIDSESRVYHIDGEQGVATPMNARVNENCFTLFLTTDHFSTFAVTLNPDTGARSVYAEISAEWDDTNQRFASVTMETWSTSNKTSFSWDYAAGEDAAWNLGSSAWTAQLNANVHTTINLTDAVNSSSIKTLYRAHGTGNTRLPDGDTAGYSEAFSVFDLLDAAEPGFSDWINGPATDVFGYQRPTTLSQLFKDFDDYRDLPSISLSSAMVGGELVLTASDIGSVAIPDDASYRWQYYDETNRTWITIATKTGSDKAELNTAPYSAALTDNPNVNPNLDGGKQVRCVVLDSSDEPLAAAELKNVNPAKQLYDQAIAEINEVLDLSNYTVYARNKKTTSTLTKVVSIPIDLSEGHYTKFRDYFYYDNVARDPGVPFSDGESYANYLAKEYLRAKKTGGDALAEQTVREIWEKYLYDLYDPNDDLGVLGNHTYYPGDKNGDGGVSTYGDKRIEWPKDEGSSFHNPNTGYTRDDLVKPLNYSVLENGVDYKRFLENPTKTATAYAAGDENVDRAYFIDVNSHAQARGLGPVVMLVTVQTSWQMFDYAHANCVPGDGTYLSIEVGGAQNNTQMANLYDIKQALIRLVEYMDTYYPGHNLLLGVNEVQHGGSYNLLNYNTSDGTVYISNDKDILLDSLYSWDSFGNCEHVHYDTNAMEAACNALVSNLANWRDIKDEYVLDYNTQIEKAVVIIGGGTENTNGTNGYGCSLPWSTYSGKGIDTVYGIRTNVGVPLNPDNVLSWLDYTGNNTGNPYHGAYAVGFTADSGSSFTKKYVASTEDAVFNTLVRIAEEEMGKKAIPIDALDCYVENAVLDDTVTDEFELDLSKAVIARVFRPDGTTYYQTAVDVENGSAVFTIFEADGETVRSTETLSLTDTDSNPDVYSFSWEVGIPFMKEIDDVVTEQTPENCTQTLLVRTSGSEPGTSYVNFNYGNVYNKNTMNLHFDVTAREDFIGSNNVFTNEGTPDLEYGHTPLDGSGNPRPADYVTYELNGVDTPEVNVPIVFEPGEGGTKSLAADVFDNGKYTLNLADIMLLDTNGQETADHGCDAIVAPVHELLDKYDQINGTISYAWVTPDGKVHQVPYSTHVTGGEPDDELASAAELAQNYVVRMNGASSVKLQVIFTPDEVRDNGNFNPNDGGVTATRVEPLLKAGSENILTPVIPGLNTTKLTVSKAWSGERNDTSHRPDTLTYRLYQHDPADTDPDSWEYYMSATGAKTDGYTATFTNLDYKTPGGDLYEYRVEEESVSRYVASVSETETIPAAKVWVQVDVADLDLTGETPYLIVYTKNGTSCFVDGSLKGTEVEIGDSTDADAPAEATGTDSYFMDNGYVGWDFTIVSGGGNTDSYMHTVTGNGDVYLKKDGALETAPKGNGDTKLVEIAAVSGSTAQGYIHISDKYLKVADNGSLGSGNSGQATAFTFYTPAVQVTPSSYSAVVTNTLDPTPVRENETQVKVKKVWADDHPNVDSVTVRLFRDGAEIDSIELNETNDWEYVFDELLYMDPNTRDVYKYTVEEDRVGVVWETAYDEKSISDPSGGNHMIPVTPAGDTNRLWDSVYYLVAQTVKVKDSDDKTNQLFNLAGSDPTLSDTVINDSSDALTTPVYAYPHELMGRNEGTAASPVIAPLVRSEGWMCIPVEENGQLVGYRFRNGSYYLGWNKDAVFLTDQEIIHKVDKHGNVLDELDPERSTLCTVDASGHIGFLKQTLNNNNMHESFNKYLRAEYVKEKQELKLKLNNDGDASKATAFTFFEQKQFAGSYDTYEMTVTNVRNDISNAGNITNHKYIDYLGDGDENNETGLTGEYYRLYLDVESDNRYKFDSITVVDYLSQYVQIAPIGVNLQIHKISKTDPTDDTLLWYGNLDQVSGSIGTPMSENVEPDGQTVIRSVIYERADWDDETTTGNIRVTFEPSYRLEEGYRYVVSFNVEATDLARESTIYPDGMVGDSGTDYPGNDTSSGCPGYYANEHANVIYSELDLEVASATPEIHVKDYQKPVIQVPDPGYKLPKTGGMGTFPYILSGLALMGAALIFSCRPRRRREGRGN